MGLIQISTWAEWSLFLSPMATYHLCVVVTCVWLHIQTPVSVFNNCSGRLPYTSKDQSVYSFTVLADSLNAINLQTMESGINGCWHYRCLFVFYCEMIIELINTTHPCTCIVSITICCLNTIVFCGICFNRPSTGPTWTPVVTCYSGHFCPVPRVTTKLRFDCTCILWRSNVIHVIHVILVHVQKWGWWWTGGFYKV